MQEDELLIYTIDDSEKQKWHLILMNARKKGNSSIMNTFYEATYMGFPEIDQRMLSYLRRGQSSSGT